LRFDRILKELKSEIVDPLEAQLMGNENQGGEERPRRDQTDSAVKAKVKTAAQPTEGSSENQVIAVGKKRSHSSQLSTASDETTTTGNDVAIKRMKKASKTDEEFPSKRVTRSVKSQSQHYSPNQIVTRSQNSSKVSSSQKKSKARRKQPARKVKSESMTLTNNDSQENLVKGEFSLESLVKGEDASSYTESVKSVKRENASSFTKSVKSLAIDPKIIKKLRNENPLFQQRVEELIVFVAERGHCNVISSNRPELKPLLTLARWCYDIRRCRKLKEQGKPHPYNITEERIEILDALGFPWTVRTFETRVEELKKFKAKFGHLEIHLTDTPTDKPYRALSRWCKNLQKNRNLMEAGKKISPFQLSKEKIKILDDLGFSWEPLDNDFDTYLKQLKIFKEKFGHCNVSLSYSLKNRPYLTLGKWCSKVRRSQKLIEEGKKPLIPLSMEQIEILDGIGFPWESMRSFEGYVEELRIFKEKFGHCNVTKSKNPANKPYISLGQWCCKIRRSRKVMEEGKTPSLKLSKRQIEILDGLRFPWELSGHFEERLQDLIAFKVKFGHCNVTSSASPANKPYLVLARWCYEIRRSRRMKKEGRTPIHNICQARIDMLDDIGFSWEAKCKS